VNQDRGRKDERSAKLANSKRSQGYTKVLRLANYYQQFIKDFISIARLLHDLVKKDQKWN